MSVEYTCVECGQPFKTPVRALTSANFSGRCPDCRHQRIVARILIRQRQERRERRQQAVTQTQVEAAVASLHRWHTQRGG